MNGLKDPGEYGQFLNRTYTMPHAMDRIGVSFYRRN